MLVPLPFSGRPEAHRQAVKGYLLGTQARPSAIGLHAPLQQSESAVQVAPFGLQAASCQTGVDLVAAPCAGKKALTVLCGDSSASSRSHAAAGKVATPTKSAKKIGEITRALMITSLEGAAAGRFISQSTVARSCEGVRMKALTFRNSVCGAATPTLSGQSSAKRSAGRGC